MHPVDSAKGGSTYQVRASTRRWCRSGSRGSTDTRMSTLSAALPSEVASEHAGVTVEASGKHIGQQYLPVKPFGGLRARNTLVASKHARC